MPRPRRLAMIAVATIAASYLAVVGLVFAFQRRLLYFPQPAVEFVDRPGLDRLRIGFPGGEVPAFHLRADGGGPTVAWFHGNAEQIAGLVPLALELRRAGVGFFAPEYPGYAGATGSGPSEEAILAAARSALDALAAAGVPPARTVLAGRSLGSGVAARLAAEGRGARLVLVSPYTSIADVAAQAYPWPPARLLVRDRFDTAALAARIAVPTLVVHGDADRVIPVEMGRAIGAAIPGAVLRSVVGAGHDDVLLGPRVLDDLAAFVRGP